MRLPEDDRTRADDNQVQQLKRIAKRLMTITSLSYFAHPSGYPQVYLYRDSYLPGDGI